MYLFIQQLSQIQIISKLTQIKVGFLNILIHYIINQFSQMQGEKKLVRVQSINTLKVLNFVVQVDRSLSQLRQTLKGLELQLNEFTFLMADKTPIAKSSENLIQLKMIMNEFNIFFIKEQESFVKQNPHTVSDIVMQKKLSEISEPYEEFQQKVEQIKKQIAKVKQVFIEKQPILKQINKNYLGQIDQFGIYSGIGRCNYPNKQLYLGEFKNGQRHGIGCYTFQNGDKYEGQYRNNQACGIGIQYFMEGDHMAAVYKNGCSNGIGIFYYDNGQRLQGKFINGKFEGEGIHFFKDGTWALESYRNGLVVKKK